MATVYSIKHTDGVRTITIQPGTLNGPGGVLTDSDLQLYGQGTLQWGAGVDQNQLRLIENFAVEEKVLSPGTPQDEVDIGVTGAGVNNPVIGQQWYNTTDTVLYAYNGAAWVPGGTVFESAVEPTNPVTGTLWYDTVNDQLMVYDTALGTFESVAEFYLLKAGDTMSGDIAMGGNEVTGLPAVPSATGAASKEYVDDEITAHFVIATGDFVNATGDQMTGTLEMFSIDPEIQLNGNGSGSTLLFQEGGANRGALLVDFPAENIILRKLTGGVTNNDITLLDTYIETHATNGKIRTPQTVGGDDIATLTTKQYVDDEINSATVNGAQIFTSLAAADLGDIAVTGGKIYINLAAGANWKQVWPAVYS